MHLANAPVGSAVLEYVLCQKAGGTSNAYGAILPGTARHILTVGAAMQGLPAGGQEVVFKGAETGQVEVIVKARTNNM